MRAHSPTFIEFVGMPGAGKTRISRQVAALLRRWGVRTVEPTYHTSASRELRRISAKLRYAVVGMTSDWVFARDVARFVVSSRQKRVLDAFGTLFNLLYLKGLIKRHHDDDALVVLDQGFLQGLWSVYVGARIQCYETGGRLLDSSCLSGARFVVVCVDAKLDSIRRRLASRGEGKARIERRRGFCSLRDGKAIEEQIIRMLSEKAKSQPKFDLIQIHNGEDVDVDSAAWSVAIRVYDGVLGVGSSPATTGRLATSTQRT